MALKTSRITIQATAFVLASLCMLGAAESAAGDGDRTTSVEQYTRVDQLISAEFRKRNAGALTIGVVENGRLVWEQHYGTLATDNADGPNAQTLYPIASVTKVVTGIMLLQLTERGVVHLTDRVDTYVPEIHRIPNPYSWAPAITLLQLATMTSGISDDRTGTPNRSPAEQSKPMTWDQQLVADLPSFAYAFEPGTRRQYSNHGYAILGLALSRAAHRSYMGYVSGEILAPLGMRDTTFEIDAGKAFRFAFGPPDTPRIVSWTQNEFQPAGGLFSTLEDLVMLMRFQLGLGPENVLSHKALAESFRLAVPSDGDLQYGDGIGFAAARNPDGALVALGHGGQTRNYISSYEFDRAAQSGIIVLASDGTNAYKPLVRRALQILHPESNGGTALKPAEEH
jgi:CubicO group peptidase (beta-lactamase class C family)